MQEKATDIGVIIGRFQVHKLHTEHVKLLNYVISRHEKVIIFLGTTQAINTRRNPMDFITRKLMIENVVKVSAILPLPDQKSDAVWSQQIHDKVREVFPSGDVTLYGSRDSFIPYYSGKWKTCELEPDTYVSATDIRDQISKKTLASEEFRAGIIYSIYSHYPTTFSTIDVAIIKGDEILLGRKKNEVAWRLIGGFVDPTDESDIAACKREVMEETGLEVSDFKFICSKKIRDWRYAGINDKGVMTRFYSAKYIFGAPEPNDDIVELKWVKLANLQDCKIVKEHNELIEELIATL